MLRQIAQNICDIDFADLSTAERNIAKLLERAGYVVKSKKASDDDVTFVLNEDVPDNPTILVNVHGGLVQDVYGKGVPVDVLVVDWDQEGVTDEDMEEDPSLFKTEDGKIGSVYQKDCCEWEEMAEYPEMVLAVEVADGKYDGPVNATYVSEWDNGTTVRSPCKFDRRTRRCFDIQQSETDVGNAQLLEEYVETEDDSFHETEGVTFNY